MGCFLENCNDTVNVTSAKLPRGDEGWQTMMGQYFWAGIKADDTAIKQRQRAIVILPSERGGIKALKCRNPLSKFPS